MLLHFIGRERSILTRYLQKFPSFHDRHKPIIEGLVGIDLEKIASMDEPNFAGVIHLVVVAEKLGALCSGYDDRLWLVFHAGGLVDREHLRIDQLLPVGLYENLESVSSVRIFKSDSAHAAAFVILFQYEIFGIKKSEAIVSIAILVRIARQHPRWLEEDVGLGRG